jgi:hypothetical protein
MKKDYCTPFRVPYSDITGDNNSALFLAQLEYWQGIKGDGYVVKSATDWWNELRLSHTQVKRIKAELESLGYIETTLIYYKGSNTTGYRFVKDAVQKALIDGLDLYYTGTKPTGTKPTGTKPTGTKDASAQAEKMLVHPQETYHSITETTTETTTETYSAETSSAVAKVLKTEFMQKAAEEAIQRGEPAKTRAKKPKGQTDPLTSEIHKYTCEADAFLKQWYFDKYQTPLISYDKDFVNIKKTFRKLIDGSANFEEKKRLTPERCFLGVQYILKNFDKLNDFDRKKISLNHIATNWSTLITTIQDYQPPVQKQNFNEPVAPVHTKLPEFYNGYALPMGISTMQFEKLGELVYRDKIMEGLIDESFMSVYEFLEKYRGELKKITTEQLNQLMKDYEIA